MGSGVPGPGLGQGILLFFFFKGKVAGIFLTLRIFFLWFTTV